jgi:hypothetical protein
MVPQLLRHAAPKVGLDRIERRRVLLARCRVRVRVCVRWCVCGDACAVVRVRVRWCVCGGACACA